MSWKILSYIDLVLITRLCLGKLGFLSIHIDVPIYQGVGAIKGIKAPLVISQPQLIWIRLCLCFTLRLSPSERDVFKDDKQLIYGKQTYSCFYTVKVYAFGSVSERPPFAVHFYAVRFCNRFALKVFPIAISCLWRVLQYLIKVST